MVVFTSGYNNIPDNNAFYSSPASSVFKPNLTPQYNTGNGQGYLYVVDAKAGNSLATIATGVGSHASPSGLGKMSAYADFAETNNTATYHYGGDLNGDVCRFNIEAGVNSVLHFAALKDASNVGQPFMTPVGLGEINNKKVIIVGAGKYLEASDLDATSFSTQSLYALKDVANDGDPEPVYNNPRSVAGIANQTVVPNSAPSKSDERVSGTSNGLNFVSGPGWYLYFPDSGERQNVASQLVSGC
ncbi:MAG: type IV pilus assembly protein PilY1 [Methylophilaceae bacterium]